MKCKVMSMAALAASTALIGLSIASDAAAYPAQGYRIIYFSGPGPDATIVGRETLSCNGHYMSTGSTSAYYTEQDEDCDLGDTVPLGPCDIYVGCRP